MKVDSIKLNNSFYKQDKYPQAAYFRGDSSGNDSFVKQNQDVTQFKEKISPALGTDFSRPDPIGSTFNQMFKTLKHFFKPEFEDGSWSDDDLNLIIYRSLTN